MLAKHLAVIVLVPLWMPAAVCAQASAYVPRPGTMTSDPQTNFALAKYAEAPSDRMAAIARTIMLFKLLSSSCRDVTTNKRALDKAVESSGFLKISAAEANDASEQGAAALNGLDYDDLAHLCAGADYLFGPHGVLVIGAMSNRSGRVNGRYDPGNPYVSIVPMHFGR